MASFVLCAGLALVVIAFALWVRWLQHRRRSPSLDRLLRVVRTRSPSPVCQLGDGPALVEGRVGSGQPLKAPLSGRSVAAFRVLVERLDGQPAHWWRLLDRTEVGDFRLHDETGAAQIEGNRARNRALLLLGFSGAAVRAGVAEPGQPLPPAVVDFLLQYGQYVPSAADEGRLRWTEFVLLEDDVVQVWGKVHLEPNTDGGVPLQGRDPYRGSPLAPVLRAETDGFLVLLDQQMAQRLRQTESPAEALGEAIPSVNNVS